MPLRADCLIFDFAFEAYVRRLADGKLYFWRLLKNLTSPDVSILLAPPLGLQGPPMLESSLGLLPKAVLVHLVLYDQYLTKISPLVGLLIYP